MNLNLKGQLEAYVSIILDNHDWQSENVQADPVQAKQKLAKLFFPSKSLSDKAKH